MGQNVRAGKTRTEIEKRLKSLMPDRQTRMGCGSQNGLWEFWVVVLRHVGLRLRVEWDLKGKQEQEEEEVWVPPAKQAATTTTTTTTAPGPPMRILFSI